MLVNLQGLNNVKQSQIWPNIFENVDAATFTTFIAFFTNCQNMVFNLLYRNTSACQ